MRDEGQPGVVGDVEPLVRVGGPRVGASDAGDEVAVRGRGAGPQAEGAVDVDPGAVLVGDVAHGVEGIERAAVDLARLRAHDGRAVGGGERGTQRVGAHRALVVGLDAHDAVGAQAEQPHGAPEGDVEVAVGQQADRRRAR